MFWVKIFKNGPSNTCGRQPFKKFEVMWSAIQTKFFKGCLPKISLGPFLNDVTHLYVILQSISFQHFL